MPWHLLATFLLALAPGKLSCGEKGQLQTTSDALSCHFSMHHIGRHCPPVLG